MDTENKYGLLTAWKGQGFKKFPLPPVFPWIMAEYAKSQIEVRKKEVQEKFNNIDVDQMWEACRPQLELWGASVLVAYIKILQGENRKTVLKDLGNKVLPNTSGGKLLQTFEQKLGIKLACDQMKECIREIRSALDIPLKDVAGYNWGEDYTEDIELMFPDVKKILRQKELRLVSKRPSIADTAASIIADRLKFSLGRPISGRTIQNILESLPL